MTVKFTPMARAKPGDPAAPRKYYPVLKSKGKVTLRQLADRVAEMSTLSSVDLAAALEAFLTIIPRELADGNIVNLGEFGTFSLRTRSEGADTAAEVTAHQITGTLVGFRPGKRFQETLDHIVYEKAAD